MRELKRWAIVGGMGVVVAALSFETFYAIVLLFPLGVLFAWAVMRAVVRFIRGFFHKNSADIGEAYRSVARAGAWAALCGVVVVGHDALIGKTKLKVETRAVELDTRVKNAGGVFPEHADGFPKSCVYGRPEPSFYRVVCTFVPPFEKGTYDSKNKRWSEL